MISRKYIRDKKTVDKRKVPAVILLRLAVFLLCIIFLCYMVFVRPSILNVIDYQGKLYATTMLSDSVLELMGKNPVSYDELIQATRDKDGNIETLKTNGKNINILKSNIVSTLTKKLNTLTEESYSIPIGTLLGSELLLGRGPSMSMKISVIGYVDAEIISRFEEAGINQTKHSLIMRVHMDYTAVVPLYSSGKSIESDYLLCETLIVGQVPQYYSDSQYKK